MTALYWLWKNSKEDIIGLCHYRRYFYCPFHDGFFRTPLTAGYIKKYLKEYDIILQKKADYGKMSLKEHYLKDLPKEGFYVCEDEVKRQRPDYMDSFNTVMEEWNGMHSCNMFIAGQEFVKKYSEWVFPILFSVQERLDYTGWSEYEQRTPGMLSELLLNVFVFHNRLRIKELPFGERRSASYPEYAARHIKKKLLNGLLSPTS